ncbi:LOW QUALITY PROTEIN: MICOS complex subunit MIC25 [Dendrobates tinctorius]|uniref:LOW QUALITY PROTEIN: MICOS complex subunit MIC25 n=1 Tax=Dendrobates tinctorius TaxID=92724 RepID=UPI003CCA5762
MADEGSAHAEFCQSGTVVTEVTVMGATESSGRRVSFGLDEEERVRVLRGVRLSDDIINRMKELQRGEQHRTSSGTNPSDQTLPPRGQPESQGKGSQRSSAGGAGQTTYAEDELYRRYEKEQAIIQEELARIAKREREAAQEQYSSAVLREKNYTNQERRRADHLAKELQHKEEELKKLDAFHKEQLTSIEKKNLEIYKMTAEQFHTAATNAEFRVKKRSYDPVCMNLQSNILKCYTENRQELLNCSDLAREYRSCVREAQKECLCRC